MPPLELKATCIWPTPKRISGILIRFRRDFFIHSDNKIYFNVYRNEKAVHPYRFIPDKGEACDLGTVDLWSLKCRYEILSPDNNRVVQSEDNIDCLSLEEGALTNERLIKAWKAKQAENYSIYIDDPEIWWKYRPTIAYTDSNDWKIKNSIGDDVLWEYKFQMIVYQYDMCNDEWKRETHTMEDPICQSNFVLTAPYTVQKTPSGNLEASTETLKKFKDVRWGGVAFSSYLGAITTSTYTPNQKVEDAMNKFIDKYEKLAVKVNGSSSLKKVPGKNIYFTYDDLPIKNWQYQKAFTVVQRGTNRTVRIEWDVDLNMMILTEWNIEFIWDCEHNQTVKWIFYASWSLIRKWVEHNDELWKEVWCDKWWLKIKWVLIWKKFNDLMKDSRSHLETWFDDNETSSKKVKIMNWASVVIEYSPSIFNKSTMPPGAEDFTTALDIYKK